jgi:hypothetical protein
MKNCEWKDCETPPAFEGASTGSQQIAIQDLKTKQKIIKTLCTAHYAQWKEEIHNLAIQLGILVS